MRAGHIEQLGSADAVYGSPATEYVARFLGIRNSVELRHEGAWVTSAGPIEGDLGLAPASGTMQLYLRPENLKLAANRADLSVGPLAELPAGRIVDALHSGGTVDYVIDVNQTTLYSSVADPRRRVHPGDAVQPFFTRSDALVYAQGRLLAPERSPGRT